MPRDDARAMIIYDGDCVFCSHYVRFVRLRETVGPVALIDARSGNRWSGATKSSASI